MSTTRITSITPNTAEASRARIAAQHASEYAPAEKVALCDDERREYETLYEHERAAIRRHILRLVGDGDLADDLLADAFIKVYRAWKDQCATYLYVQRRAFAYRAATTVALDELRRRKFPAHVADPFSRSLDLLSFTAHATYTGDNQKSHIDEPLGLSELVSPDTLPERATIALDEWNGILALCRSDRERVIVNMRAADFTFDEIAYVLVSTGVCSTANSNIVKMLWHRFVKRVHKALQAREKAQKAGAVQLNLIA